MLFTYVEDNEIVYSSRVDNPEVYLKLLESPRGFKIDSITYYLDFYQLRMVEIEGEYHEEIIIYMKLAN